MIIHRKFAPRTNNQCRWKQEPIVLSNILSTFMMYSGNEYEKLTSKESNKKNVTYITHNFSFHRTCLYIQGHDRENTPNSSLTKRCLIWFTMFVVESFYNRKIKFVDIGISGKGMIWGSLLTRDVSISIISMTTKALLLTVHYKVFSNYVFKSVYRLYKKLYVGCIE